MDKLHLALHEHPHTLAEARKGTYARRLIIQKTLNSDTHSKSPHSRAVTFYEVFRPQYWPCRVSLCGGVTRQGWGRGTRFKGVHQDGDGSQDNVRTAFWFILMQRLRHISNIFNHVFFFLVECQRCSKACSMRWTSSERISIKSDSNWLPLSRFHVFTSHISEVVVQIKPIHYWLPFLAQALFPNLEDAYKQEVFQPEAMTEVIIGSLLRDGRFELAKILAEVFFWSHFSHILLDGQETNHRGEGSDRMNIPYYSSSPL